MNAQITTSTLARLTDRTPGAIRMAVARRGDWCGIRPRKLPNGRLLWPREQVEKLLAPNEIPHLDGVIEDLTIAVTRYTREAPKLHIPAGHAARRAGEAEAELAELLQRLARDQAKEELGISGY